MNNYSFHKITIFILWLNVLVGILHGISHITEERILLTTFDFIFPVLTQILIPAGGVYLYQKRELKKVEELDALLLVNFVLITIYSVFYHFFSQTIDNIIHSSASLSGLLFISTSYSLLLLNSLAVLIFFMKLILVLKDRQSTNVLTV